MTEQTTPDDITAAVRATFGRCPDERLGTVMRSLTAHLHAFVKDVGLTEEEWRAAIEVLTATGRHPGRPAHIHVIVRAPGHCPVTTHVFDRASQHIGSDAVFTVKPSLLRELTARSADDPGRPPGITGAWWSLARDFVLVLVGPAG